MQFDRIVNNLVEAVPENGADNTPFNFFVVFHFSSL